MDATQWTLEANKNNHNTSSNQVHEERKVARPNKEVVNCPRCKSTNTKFCYYNNYSSTQPRYFCKACRRYWTQGGSLRNVPVGGGSRKNKRSSSSSQIPKPVDHLSTTTFSSQTQYLNLGGFQQQYHHDLSQFQKPPKIENSSNSTNNLLNFLSSSSNTSTNLTYVLPQHMLSTGTGLNSFNSNPGLNIVQEFKPMMGGFSFHESAGFQQQDGFNQRETTSDQNMGQGNSTVYWN